MGYMQIKHQNLHSYIIEKVKKKKIYKLGVVKK